MPINIDNFSGTGGAQAQAPRKSINIKNFAGNPPSRPPPLKTPQILYVWGLLSLQNAGKKPKHKGFRGGGGS